jgi:hypothetical protein
MASPEHERRMQLIEEEHKRDMQLLADENERYCQESDDRYRPEALKALEEIARRERGRGKQMIVISLTEPRPGILPPGFSPTYVKSAKQINEEYARLSSKRTDEAVETIVTVVNALGMNPYKKRRRGRSGFGISIPLPGPFRWGKSL